MVILKILDHFLINKNRWSIINFSLILFILIGVVDYLSGYEIALSILYLIPISLAAWYGDRKLGLIFAILSAIAWTILDFASGHAYTVNIIGFWNGVVRFGFFLIIVYLLSEVNRELKKIKVQAATDALTGAYNTRGFYFLGNLELERSRRFNEYLSVVYIDLDNFKKINDIFGHRVGDSVLKQVVMVIKKNIRINDIIGRLGGDEFVILFSKIHPDYLRKVIKKIQILLLQNMKHHHWSITFSMGVITFIDQSINLQSMISMADKVMYQVKNNKKNGIKFKLFKDKKLA